MEPLSDVVTLEQVDLSFNQIPSVEGLKGLTRLVCLKLAANNIEAVDDVTQVFYWRCRLLSLGSKKCSS